MSDLRVTFAKNVKTFRQDNHLSQEELAFACDLHRTYISDIERSKRNVSIDNIEKIAIALGVPSYKLLIPHDTIDK